jgi:hypothetical protein
VLSEGLCLSQQLLALFQIGLRSNSLGPSSFETALGFMEPLLLVHDLLSKATGFRSGLAELPGCSLDSGESGLPSRLRGDFGRLLLVWRKQALQCLAQGAEQRSKLWLLRAQLPDGSKEQTARRSRRSLLGCTSGFGSLVWASRLRFGSRARKTRTRHRAIAIPRLSMLRLPPSAIARIAQATGSRGMHPPATTSTCAEGPLVLLLLLAPLAFVSHRRGWSSRLRSGVVPTQQHLLPRDNGEGTGDGSLLAQSAMPSRLLGCTRCACPEVATVSPMELQLERGLPEEASQQSIEGLGQ